MTSTNPPSIPSDYVPSRWVTLYTKQELRFLAEKLDARVKEQRQVIIRLRAQLERAPLDTEVAILQYVADHYTEDPRR
ncbi:hypothetical protein [Sinomonas albida]|uniref:hypothetical protein n=1 Tax=Sinomonas albida TaxID=369942 RepID=UPI0030170E22